MNDDSGNVVLHDKVRIVKPKHMFVIKLKLNSTGKELNLRIELSTVSVTIFKSWCSFSRYLHAKSRNTVKHGQCGLTDWLIQRDTTKFHQVIYSLLTIAHTISTHQ